jgi:hypothetical protein
MEARQQRNNDYLLSTSEDENYEQENDCFSKTLSRFKKIKKQTKCDVIAKCKDTKVLENILDSADVTSAFGITNISDRKLTILSAAIAKANNENIAERVISRSTKNL